MSMDPGIIAAGAFAGYSMDKVKPAIDAALRLQHGPSAEEATLLALAAMVEDLSIIRAYQQEQTHQKDEQHDYPANLYAYPNGWISTDTLANHFCVYTPVAVAAGYIVIPQLGNFTLAIPVGWSTIDRPQGSKLALAPGTAGSVAIVVRTAEVVYGQVL